MYAFCIPDTFPGLARRRVMKNPQPHCVPSASARNSHGMIFLDDHHPLTPIESYSCKKHGGGGTPHLSSPRKQGTCFSLPSGLRPLTFELSTLDSVSITPFLSHLSKKNRGRGWGAQPIVRPRVHHFRVHRAISLNPFRIMRLSPISLYTPHAFLLLKISSSSTFNSSRLLKFRVSFFEFPPAARLCFLYLASRPYYPSVSLHP